MIGKTQSQNSNKLVEEMEEEQGEYQNASKNKDKQANATCSKKIRKRKSKNNDHLLVRKKEYKVLPIILSQPQQYQYHLFNDIVIDLDMLGGSQTEHPLNRGLLWHTFKSISQVNIMNDGSMMNWIQENFNQPILNSNSMIYMLKSLSSQAAYQQANDLNIVNEYSLLLSKYLNQMNADYRIKLFEQRRAYSIAQASEYIKNHPRNCISVFYEYIYNDRQQSHEYRRMGFSKKLLSLVGIDIKDAPSILLRRGFIDICSKEQQALLIIKRNILSLFNQQMSQFVEFQKKDGEHITLEGIPFKCVQHVRVYNSTYNFDKQHCYGTPIKPDTVTEVIIEVPEEELRKIYEIRSSMNLLTKYSLDDFVNGEFQYLVQVENFLEKYYNSPYSYRKNRSAEGEKNLISSQSSIRRASTSHSHNSNSTSGDRDHLHTYENESSSSSNEQDNYQNNKRNQQHPNNSYSSLHNSQGFKENQNNNSSCISEEKYTIHPSIKNIKQQQTEHVNKQHPDNYYDAYCPEPENIYWNDLKFASVEDFINEYKYNPFDARIQYQETLNIGTYQ